MTDVIVIGGGPGGSTAANLLVRKGYSVLLLEREHFPRFQIGESLLPYNNELLTRLGVIEQVTSHGSVPKFGAEFITGDGKLSYIFQFFRHLPKEYSRSFQVKRSEFDEILLRKAAGEGVEVREGFSVRDVDLSNPERVVVTAAEGEGAPQTFEARFVVDASGHASIIGSRHGGKEEEAELRKVAIFAHYTGVEPSSSGRDEGNTVIAILRDAWIWLIPLPNGVTSVGLVIDRDLFTSSGLGPEEMLERSIWRTPYVSARMKNAERLTQVYARKDFSYRMKHVFGPNFALVGDAAGFFDPVFSTGVFVAMKSADKVADAVDLKLRTGSTRQLRQYQRSLHEAFRRYYAFISNFYRREFLEVFLQPGPHFGLLPIIVGLLAGNVFEEHQGRWRIRLFFALTRIQRRRQVIAKPIAWDTLPTAATSQG